MLKKGYGSIQLVNDTSYGPYGRDCQIRISGEGLSVGGERVVKNYEFPAKFEEWFEAIPWGDYNEMGDNFGPYRSNDRENNRRGTVCRFTLEDIVKKLKEMI